MAQEAKTLFNLQGTKVFNNSSEDLVVKQRLPNGTYSVNFDGQRGIFFLETREPFELPKKLYGDVAAKADRVINTFMDRKGNTGVLLTGTKGNGKTLLAKYISRALEPKDVPTIVINHAFCGEDFNNYVASFDRPCLFIIDEFEKIFEERKLQERMLTLLDGLANSKHMFIVTVNDIFGVNKYMIARPNRFFYRFDYTQLTPEFVREYSEDNLKPEYQKFVPQMSLIRTKNPSINFDAIQALIEEVNRYGDSPLRLVDILNVTEGQSQLKMRMVGIKNINKPEQVVLANFSRTYSSGDRVNVWSFSPEFYKEHQAACDAIAETTSTSVSALIASVLPELPKEESMKVGREVSFNYIYLNEDDEDVFNPSESEAIGIKDSGEIIINAGNYEITMVEQQIKNPSANFFLPK